MINPGTLVLKSRNLVRPVVGAMVLCGRIPALVLCIRKYVSIAGFMMLCS
jgi:hypothetical protein